MPNYSLSTSSLDLELKATKRRLIIERLGLHASPWTFLPDSSLISIFCDGLRLDNTNLKLNKIATVPSPGETRHCVAYLENADLQIEYHIQVYNDTALVEIWPVIWNVGRRVHRLTRVDMVSIRILGSGGELFYYESDWGAEFESNRIPLSGEIILDTCAGRSSKGKHPWFALMRNDQVLSGSIAWSGNWVMRFEPAENGKYQISLGLSDWQFTKELEPGQSMDCPHGILVFGNNLNEVSQQYALVGRKYWYPHNDLSRRLPVEWNHWWSYEDDKINSSVFQENVEVALELGIDLCTLDAGWFGGDKAGTYWFDYRGDWDLINRHRFPESLRPLSERVQAAGMSFGLWCEIEGIGSRSQLIADHPDFIAERDGTFLGYACFGNPVVQEWAFQTLSKLITEFDCDWLKLDFNIDPGAGCNRTDHGHGKGDGLFEHYQGYYRTLERLRTACPQVVLENCSSGGLRIDLGMLRNTHLTFLSDPDWPVHSLQVFWGASTMLAPDVCLHWSFSDWLTDRRPAQQNFNPHNPNLSPHQLDYYTRIAMLGIPGFSQKLPDLPEWIIKRLSHHIRIYQEHVRPFVREAVLFRLTDQPRRNGSGPRWCAFQYSLPEQDQHLLFVFRLPGGEKEQVIRLKDLAPDRVYTIMGFDGENQRNLTGNELMNPGIRFDNLEEEGSEILQIY